MRWTIGLILALAAIVLFSAAFAAGPVSSKLTADELTRVKAGEIVVKNEIKDGSESGYGVAYGIIKGTPEQFWQVIFDYPHYTEFYPRLKKVTPVNVTDKRAVVEFHMDATVKTMVYTTDGVLDDDRMGMKWTLDMSRPHQWFKANEGYWKLEMLDENTILAEYRVMVVLDLGMFSSVATKIVNAMAKDDLPEVVVATRKRVESGGTWTRAQK